MKYLTHSIPKTSRKFIFKIPSPSNALDNVPEKLVDTMNIDQAGLLTPEHIEKENPASIEKPSDKEIKEAIESFNEVLKAKQISPRDFQKILLQVAGDDQKILFSEIGELEARLFFGYKDQQNIKLGSEFKSFDNWEERMPEAIKKLIGEKEGQYKNFEAIPESVFLGLTREERVQLFVIQQGDDYKVDFHESNTAFKATGLGDLIPANKPEAQTNYVKINGKIGKRSIYNNSKSDRDGKVGYLGKDGEYLGVNTNDVFTLKVSVSEIKAYEESLTGNNITIKSYSEAQEKKASEGFRKSVVKAEKERLAFFNEFKKNEPLLFKKMFGSNESTEKINFNEFVSHMEKLSYQELILIQKAYMGDRGREFFNKSGIRKYSGERKLIAALNSKMPALEKKYPELLNILGGVSNAKKTLLRLSMHETGNRIQPFNWAHHKSSSAAGYFHFVQNNVESYKVNICNAEQAVEGEMALLNDEIRNLKHKGAGTITTELLLGAHNSGASAAVKNKPVGSNPAPSKFASLVLNKNIGKSESELS